MASKDLLALILNTIRTRYVRLYNMTDSTTARFVCINCKRRKKRCDKALPTCTQCIQLGAECVYLSQSEPTGLDEMHNIHSRLMRLEQRIYLEAHRSENAYPPASNTKDCSPSQSLRLPSSPSSLSSDAPVARVEQYLANVVNSILQSEDASVTEDDIHEAYFKHISKWLPIISQRHFHTQLDGGRSMVRRPEIDLLLVCMYLLVKDPCHSATGGELRKHYKSARSAYFILQADSIGSTELMQSGLLLATYEHASGLVEQAYATIWTCARMMHSLRLQEKFRSKMYGDHDEQTEGAEAHALWWAIRIRERFISLEDQMRDRPLASQHPTLNDYLPVDVNAWESSPNTVSLLGPRLDDGSMGLLGLDTFGREAQACYLLSQTLELRHQRIDTRNVQTIATSLQRFLNLLMDPATGTWGTFCGATSLTISSMYELYSNYNPEEEIRLTRRKPHQSQDAELVLSTMTRIVIDIAHATLESFSNFNITAISPSYGYLFYRAGLELLLSGDIQNEKTQQDFCDLRRCIWYFSHRWLVADTYLVTLEASARALGIDLPPLGEFVRPTGVLPGLC